MQKQKGGFRRGFFLLTGGVIGAGFFVLPRTVYNAGITSGILIMCAVGILVTIMHLILGEVSLSLPGHKTFVGMARELFPNRLARATLYISVINNIIGIIAYIILGGAFLQALLLLCHINIHIIWSMFIYVIVIGYFGIISISSLNKWDSLIVTILLTGISLVILSSTSIGGDAYSSTSDFFHNFKVYGIALFALSSINAIPLLYHSTGSSAIKMRNVILTSGFTVTILAILFTVAIISMSGEYTSDNSIFGLLHGGHPVLAFIGCIVGLSAMMSCHIPLLQNLKEVFSRDIKMSPLGTWIFITLLPFIFILYFTIGLIDLLGVAGSLLGGMLFILVCLLNIYLHTSKQKITIIPMIRYDYIRSWILCVLCSLGVLYQILSFY